MRLLLPLVLILIGVLWWRARAAGPRQTPPSRKANAAPEPHTPASTRPTPEPMCTCALCGLIVPSSEALRDADGATYCSPAHRQQARHH